MNEVSSVDFPLIVVSGNIKRVLTYDESQAFWEMIRVTDDNIWISRGGKALAAAIEELNQTTEGLQLKTLSGYPLVQGHGIYQGKECVFRSQGQHARLKCGSKEVSLQVVPDDDKHGADYLTPAECVVIIRELLIPGLDITNAIFQGLTDFLSRSKHGE